MTTILRRLPENWLSAVLALILGFLMWEARATTRELKQAIQEVHSIDRSVVRELNKLRETLGIVERKEGYQQRPET
jgi:hypothetical protein